MPELSRFYGIVIKVVEPFETKAWGLRQFTVEDLDGHRFYFHHDEEPAIVGSPGWL